MTTSPDPITLLEQNPDGLFAVDAHGKVVYANPAGTRLLGEPAAWSFDTAHEDTVELDLPDGVVAEMRMVPTTWEGEPAFVATLRNVTRRREASREQVRTQRRLVDLSVEAGRAALARSIVHTGGNALNSVTVGMSSLEERLRGLRVRTLGRVGRRLAEPDPPPASELARHGALLQALEGHLDAERERMLDEVAALRERVEHLRALLQLEHGIDQPRMVERISLDEIVAAALSAVEATYDRDHIVVTASYGAIPDAHLDRYQIQQALHHLLVNARDALLCVPTAQRRVTVRTQWVDGVATVRIDDTGIGFGADVQARLFEAGFTTKRDGLGYGLHTAAVAMHALGGTIHADSAGRGRGATFALEVPLSPA